MGLSGPSSWVATDQKMILGFGIFLKVHLLPKILCFNCCIVKQEMELSKQEMELSGPSGGVATD